MMRALLLIAALLTACVDCPRLEVQDVYEARTFCNSLTKRLQAVRVVDGFTECTLHVECSYSVGSGYVFSRYALRKQYPRCHQ
jgi:hypothetical protein